MDLLKKDNWEDLQAKLEQLWGEEAYESIAKDNEFRSVAKVLIATDEWVTEKMNVYRALSKKKISYDEKIQERIQEANERIIGYIKILKKKEDAILDDLEERLSEIEERGTKQGFVEGIELIDEELSAYFDDYRQIWNYQVDFGDKDDLDRVQKNIDRLIDIGGFKEGVLKSKIEIAEELLGEIEEEILRYRKLDKNVLDAPPDSLVIGFRGKDILRLFNNNLPGNSHGFRSVTTHLKFMLQINNALRKGGFDNWDRFNEIVIPLLEDKDFGDWSTYLKKASRMTKLLAVHANPGNILKNSDFANKRDLLDEIVKRRVHAKRILDKLRNDFADLL